MLLVELQRGAAPSVSPQSTGRYRWHNLVFRFSGDADLDRFERQLEELVRVRVRLGLRDRGHPEIKLGEQVVGDVGKRLAHGGSGVGVS